MNDWPDKIPTELDEVIANTFGGEEAARQELFEIFTSWATNNLYGYKGSDTIPLNNRQLRRMVVAQGVVGDVLKNADAEESLTEILETVKLRYKAKLDTLDVDAVVNKKGRRYD